MCPICGGELIGSDSEYEGDICRKCYTEVGKDD